MPHRFTTTNQRIGIALLLLAAAGLWVHASHAFSVGYSESTTDFETGETTEKCVTADITAGIQQLQSGYAQRFLSSIQSDYQAAAREFAVQFAQCIGANLISGGNGKSAWKTCKTDVGGAAYSQATTLWKTRLKTDFLDDCSARSSLSSVVDGSRAALAQNGREGGPAFVQDYRQMRADSRYRGTQVARNQMANTDYCPWLRGSMAGYFNFDPGRGVALTGERENGYYSYTKSSGCSLPDGYDPLAPESQTTESLAALTLPTNSIWGSYLLAQSNIQRQKAAEELADEREFVATGGIGAYRDLNPNTGNSCAVMAPDGTTCLKYSSIKQPSGGVQADVQAARQSEYDWLTNDRENMMQDVRLRMFSSLLDATTEAIDTDYQLDMGDQDVIDNPDNIIQPPASYQPGSNPTPPPPSGVPVPTPDPFCAVDAPDCVGQFASQCRCVRCDGNMQILAQTIVLEATQQTITEQSPPAATLVVDNRVERGNWRTFAGAVCATNFFASGTCRVHPTNDNEIVLIGSGLSFAVDIIAPDGSVRMPGKVIRSCDGDSGAQ